MKTKNTFRNQAWMERMLLFVSESSYQRSNSSLRWYRARKPSPDLTLCDSLTQNDPELSLETDLWSRSTAPMLRSPQEYAI